MLTRTLPAILLLVIVSLNAGIARAQDDDHDAHHHHAHIHFSHPLIAESPSPDTKIRFDYFYQRFDDDGVEAADHTARLEFEYAFRPSFSIEVNAPYTVHRENFPGENRQHTGNAEVALKFANFHFEEKGLLLGYGAEFGLPTGSDRKGIGSSHVFEVTPYVDMGYQRDRLQVVAFTSLSIPANQHKGEDEPKALGYNLSFLYQLPHHLEPLIELDGESALSGGEGTAFNITPGFKFRPLKKRDFSIGLGTSFPLTHRKEFQNRIIVSAFYHF
ncbi:MAG: hypothetical protein WCD76_22105 [Pyrinomonadaceae bacterium]